GIGVPSVSTDAATLFPPTVQPVKSPVSNPGFVNRFIGAECASTANVRTIALANAATVKRFIESIPSAQMKLRQFAPITQLKKGKSIKQCRDGRVSVQDTNHSQIK